MVNNIVQLAIADMERFFILQIFSMYISINRSTYILKKYKL